MSKKTNTVVVDKIKAAAADKYKGDLDLAIAEHLMGETVIVASGGAIPAGADYPYIAEIREAIEAGKPIPKKELQPDAIEQHVRPDSLNEPPPIGDPARTDKDNKKIPSRHRSAPDPERSDDLNYDEDKPEPDKKRPNSMNEKRPVPDPERPDEKNRPEDAPEADPEGNG